jgi:hypothetical protein
MLNAGAVVNATANSQPVAAIDVTTNTSSSDAISLDGSGSTAGPGRQIKTYTWSILTGADTAHLINGATPDRASLVFTGKGTVAVRLTVEDSVFALNWVNQTVTSTTAASTDTGGGALDWGWLLGLAAAVLTLARRRPV